MRTNGQPPVGISKNIKQVGRMDLPGGGSVVVENGYAYVGHMDPPHGTSIIDVRDPKNPKVVAHLEIALELLTQPFGTLVSKVQEAANSDQRDDDHGVEDHGRQDRRLRAVQAHDVQRI